MELADQIRHKGIGDLFSENERLKIPSYQRRYSWEEEHCKDLWNDLSSLEDGENHFFGTIVFKSSGEHVAQAVNEIDIVDGQQRITTVSILLCAIRDYLKDNFAEDQIENRVENIENSLWLVDRDGQKQGLRLVLGNLDQMSYENLVEQRPDEVDNDHIAEAYEFYYNQLDDLEDLEQIKDFHDRILDQLIYVSITAESHSDAYQLFEAMNNRGLSLSPIDLMKNYLLMKSAKEPNTDEDRVEDLWGQTIKNVDSITGLSNPGVTFFRQFFMSSQSLGISKKITKSKLYEPTFTETIEDTNDIELLLEDIRDQSELYRKLLNQEVDLFSRSANSELNRLLRDAKIVSITPFTLFLRAFSETDDVDLLKDLIEMSNSLLIRRQICDRSTGPHDTIFNQLSHDAFDHADPADCMREYLLSEDWFPGDELFIRNFQREDFSRSDRTKYVLARIEEEHFGHGGKQVVESRYQVHIEHILPERHGKNLIMLWLQPFDISEDEHSEFKKKIGNLTLLEEKPNIQASNRSLEKKQQFYTEDATDFEMTHEFQDVNEWGVGQIIDRSQELGEIAAKVWGI